MLHKYPRNCFRSSAEGSLPKPSAAYQGTGAEIEWRDPILAATQPYLVWTVLFLHQAPWQHEACADFVSLMMTGLFTRRR